MILLFIIFISINFIISTTYYECSDFETIKKTSCESITFSNTTHKCKLINDKCIVSYIGCEQYTGDNNQTCQQIAASEAGYKCIIKDVEGTNKCTPVKKSCSEYVKGDVCSNLDPGDDKKRCILVGDKCESHYKACADEKDQNKCPLNIPEAVVNKCIWDSELKCIDNYGKCDDYKGNDQNVCKGIKPLNSESNALDHLSKCLFDSSAEKKCDKVSKTCKDFIYGDDDDSYCEAFTTSTPDKTMCALLNKECKEQFITCEIYNALENGLKNKTFCEAIIPYDTTNSVFDYTSKCVFIEDTSKNTKTCKLSKKDCSEIKDESDCKVHIPENSDKMCVFINKQCKEVYKSCDIYNNKDEIPKNVSFCESIEIFTEDKEIDYSNQCVFKEADGICSPKAKKCDNYKSSQSKEYCININLGAESKNKCALINKECIEQPDTCEDYEGTNRTICQNIVTSEEKKCILEKDKDCKTITKLCSEYSGKDKDECRKYRALDKDYKKCIMVNDKCTEQYLYCSDYVGNNKEICESILPYDESGSDVLYAYKCVLDTKEGCIRKSKDCSEAKTKNECDVIFNSLRDEDDKKHCLFYNNICSEQYKLCTDYTKDVDSTICNSIIPSNYNTHKCVFKNGNPTADPPVANSCIEEAISCNDFKFESIREECEVIALNKIGKKCSFSNGLCSEVSETCLELANNAQVTSEICESATTSDPKNKKCSLKSDKSGCEEIQNKKDDQKEEKPQGDSSKETKPKSDNKQENESNSSGKKYLSKLLLIIMICLIY